MNNMCRMNKIAGWIRYALRLMLFTGIAMLASDRVDAAVLLIDQPIIFNGSEIKAALDLKKKEVRIIRLVVDRDMPAGKLHYELSEPYVVPLVSAPKSIRPDEITKLNASNVYDGVGMEVQIKLTYSERMGKWTGTININIQQEETGLSYSAQQLDIRQ
jgi:hypothetical protein